MSSPPSSSPPSMIRDSPLTPSLSPSPPPPPLSPTPELVGRLSSNSHLSLSSSPPSSASLHGCAVGHETHDRSVPGVIVVVSCVCAAVCAWDGEEERGKEGREGAWNLKCRRQTAASCLSFFCLYVRAVEERKICRGRGKISEGSKKRSAIAQSYSGAGGGRRRTDCKKTQWRVFVMEKSFLDCPEKKLLFFYFVFLLPNSWQPAERPRWTDTNPIVRSEWEPCMFSPFSSLLPLLPPNVTAQWAPLTQSRKRERERQSGRSSLVPSFFHLRS